nr:uncharacterized protein LOC124224031 [Neodiprion pinetum]
MLEVNTENLVRYKGKPKKKSVVAGRLKLIERNKEKPDVARIEKPTNILRGMRLIDPNEVNKNIICSNCKKQLAFNHIVEEKTTGFHYIWTMKCDTCSTLTKCHSSRSHFNDGHRYYDANTAAVLGAVHSGVGCNALRKIAMCIDMPVLSQETYKRYERKIGPLIEEAAKDSCQGAAAEEQNLVVEHIDMLRDKL